MKKTYKAPVMIVLTIGQNLLQSASLGKDGQTTISNNNQVLSRERNSFWDDEEE